MSKAALTQLTMPFIANQGQLDAQVAYYAPTLAGTVYVTKQGQVVYSLSARHDGKPVPGRLSTTQGWTLTQDLLTSASLKPMAEGKSEAHVNYFVGQDRASWRASLPTSERVSLGQAWPGIEVSLEAHGDSVESFYTLAPGADVDRIQLSLSGAAQLFMQRDELVAETGVGALTFSAPRAWQEIHGVRHPVPVHYRLHGSGYGFQLGPHDPHADVVIDPDLQATFLGGSAGNTDLAVALALDSSGDVYVAGYSTTTAFPGTSGGAQAAVAGRTDTFVAKLSADLSVLEQATYLGGSDLDYPSALAIGPSGDVYVSGETASTDFPGTAGGAQAAHNGAGYGYDGFIARLSADLTTLEQATYLGGSGSDNANTLAVDAAGNVYVAGDTSSADFPGTAGGAQQASHGADTFVAKLNAGLTTLQQATYLGGTGLEFTQGMAFDAAGDVYVTGYTYSKDFPGTAGGAQASLAGGANGDVFIAKLNPALTTLDQASYLGGSSDDYARAIAIGASGDVYVAGSTDSGDFPGTTGGAQATNAGPFGTSEVFVARLNAGLTTLDQATYLGTSTNEWAYSMVVGPSGDVYVAGVTVNPNFPGTAGGTQATYGGGSQDVFIAKFNPTLTMLTQSTYFGGTGMDELYFGKKLAIDTAGSVYVAGDTRSLSLPGTAGRYQTGNDEVSAPTVFIARLPADLKAHAGSTVLALTLGAPTQATLGDTVQYSLSVTNSSIDTAATGVTLVDKLPAQASFLTAISSQGNCNAAKGVVTCNLGSLAANGGSATVSVKATTTDSGTAVDAALVSADQSLDPASTSTASVDTNIHLAASISGIADQVTTPGHAVGPIPFTLGGTGTLTVTASASNPTLLPAASLVINSACGSSSLNCAISVGPAASQIGTSTVTLTVTDTFGGEAQTSFKLTVNDLAPVAGHADIADLAGKAINGFLAASASYSGQTLGYSLVSPPSHGQLVITDTTTGAFTYTPALAYVGSDAFTYQVTDAFGTPSNIGTATVTVNDVAAVAKAGNVSTSEGGAFNGTLFASVSYPSQTLTYQIASSPSHGSVQITNDLTGGFSYTPVAGFAGPDSFTFVAVDTYGTASNAATESIYVNPVAPIANDGSIDQKFTGIVRGQLSATAALPGQSFVYQIVTQPGIGSLWSFDPHTGVFEYKAKGHFLGTDSFTFEAVDTSSGAVSNVATETITLTANNPGIVSSPTPPRRPCTQHRCTGRQ